MPPDGSPQPEGTPPATVAPRIVEDAPVEQGLTAAPAAPLTPDQRGALWNAGRAFLAAKGTSDKDMISQLRAQAPETTQEVMFDVVQVLFAVQADPPAVDWFRTEGLGAPMDSAHRVLNPADADLQRVGLTRTSFDEILSDMRLGGAVRLQRFACMIDDPYHGQPGLVVNQDAAFARGDAWLVLQGERNGLSFSTPCPPDGLTCAPEESGWFLCRPSPSQQGGDHPPPTP